MLQLILYFGTIVNVLIIPLLSFILMLFHPAPLMAHPQSYPTSQPTKKLIVGVVHDPPYIVKENSGEWTGINVDIWKAVAQSLKVDYTYKEMKFQELLDALKDSTIDVSIEAFYVMADREMLMDYSFAFGNARIALATLPEKIHHPWWTAVRIFFSWGTFKIVLYLCLALCILGFLFWLVERKSNPDHFGGGLIRGVGSGIYWVGSTLASGVCFGIDLKSFTARILGLIWMLVCAIALSTLIAALTSTLSANRQMVEVVSDERLQHMHLGGVKAGAEYRTLKNLGGKYTLYEDEGEALNALIKGDIEGFLYDEVTLHYYRDHDFKDKILVYPTGVKRFSYGFGFPKDSPLRTKVNFALLTLMESPDWTYLLKRHGLAENFEEIQAPVIKRRRR